MQNMTEPIRDRAKIEQMKDFLYEKDDKYYVMFLIGIESGMQISMILDLKVKDVQGCDRVTVADRYGRKKDFQLPADLQKCIDDYIMLHDYAPDTWLIPAFGTSGKPMQMSKEQAYRVLHKAGLQAGIPNVGARTPRKTFGYWYYKDTGDLKGLTKLFGQDRPAVTAEYLCLDASEYGSCSELSA